MNHRLSLRRKLALDIVQSQYKELVRQHPLRQLFWECTLRCNLQCRHCGSDCRQTAQTPDMPFADFARVLDDVAAHTDPHQVFVILSGGEPLMRADLAQCGRAIYEKGFPWGIVTNGYALTRRRFEELLQAGMHTLTISLDGLEANHDWMRGRKGSFQKAAQAIAMAARFSKTGTLTEATPGSDVTPASDCLPAKPKRPLGFDVVTCVNRRNLDELPQIRDFLCSMGVREWRLFTVFPAGRAAQDPELSLDGAQLRQLLEFIRTTRRQSEDIRPSFACEGFLGNFEGEVRDHFYSCQAGITVGSVLADGAISACASIRSDYHQGNIYRDRFWEVWEKRFEPYRDRSWARKDDCADCRFFKYCQGGGMHLRDGEGRLLQCAWQKLEKDQA